MPFIEVIFIVLHACRAAKKSLKAKEELCVLGVVTTNALSDWLTYETAQNGGRWLHRFEKGKTTASVKRIGDDCGQWQRICFRPSPEFFEITDIVPALAEWMQPLLMGKPVTVTLKSPTSSVSL